MNGAEPEWEKIMARTNKATLVIWLYNVPQNINRKIYAHDAVIRMAGDVLSPRPNRGVIDTYDVSFFCFDYLSIFSDVCINWTNAKGNYCITSLRECLDNRCPYLAKVITRDHDMQRIFWTALYRNNGTVVASSREDVVIDE